MRTLIADFTKSRAPLVCLTAYTTPIARILDPHVDMLLVGDSLGMVLYGFETTLPVTLDMMIAHGAAVVGASSRALIVVDMPYGTYEESPDQALRNATRVLNETGCAAIKLEGDSPGPPRDGKTNFPSTSASTNMIPHCVHHAGPILAIRVHGPGATRPHRRRCAGLRLAQGRPSAPTDHRPVPLRQPGGLRAPVGRAADGRVCLRAAGRSSGRPNRSAAQSRADL